MLMDTIERNDFFRNYPDKDKWWEFHKHALWVLVELKAEESLSTVLKLLKQDDAYNWYWFGDFSTEDFWEMWFSSILAAFLAMDEEDPALDGEVISSIMANLIFLEAEELLPQIHALAERDLIFEGYVGDIESIERDIKKPRYTSTKRKVRTSIFERYEDVMNWHSYRMKYDKSYRKRNEPKPLKPFEDPFLGVPQIETIKREGKKVGRNAPCPCGSGKKYKKCCLKK